MGLGWGAGGRGQWQPWPARRGCRRGGDGSRHGGAAVALVGAQVAEAAATLVAGVRRGAAVDALVGVQVAKLLEAAAALRAGVGALAGVDALVPLQPREHREALPALGAGEGALGAAVAQPVALQAGRVAEALPALRAHEGLLPGVDALVLPQVAQVVEVAAAFATLIAPLYLPLPRPARPRPPVRSPAPPGVAAALPQWGRRTGGGLQGVAIVVPVHHF